jgi:hypothetical protein
MGNRPTSRTANSEGDSEYTFPFQEVRKMVRKIVAVVLILGVVVVFDVTAFSGPDIKPPEKAEIRRAEVGHLQTAVLANAWQDEDCEQPDPNLCHGNPGGVLRLRTLFLFTVRVYLSSAIGQRM